MTTSEKTPPDRSIRIDFFLLSLLSVLVYLVIRAYVATLRKSFSNCEDYRARYDRGEGMILSFWHNQILAMPTLYFGKPFAVSTLISLSRDGELAARIVRRWGIGAVRGSSSRRATAAMKELLRLGQDPHHHFALTPDGPKGPAFFVKEGLIVLAQRSGKPIVPLAISYQRYLQLNSWDGFLLPYPFTKAYFVCGNPVHIPEQLEEKEFPEFEKQVFRAMVEANAHAMSLRKKKT